MNSRKKIPMRKCVATGEMRPKKELIRIVRSKEGEVSIDPTGKKSGRGAYLTKEKDTILLAKKKNILSKQLEANIEDSIYDELLDLIEKEKRPI
ncbi:YlxR family protein [Mesobacillus maritimus]|uniref:RNase P modulator RnpM n=1 Tax=Mesobacillus maritimus TaxID=1643336 RepID=UPI00203F683B|nr:YlxR family RNase P modulator [Mesobacillus maritimus]MCM3667753.1 YlxR family protein [Mesobacillus maritimus]